MLERLLAALIVVGALVFGAAMIHRAPDPQPGPAPEPQPEPQPPPTAPPPATSVRVESLPSLPHSLVAPHDPAPWHEKRHKHRD